MDDFQIADSSSIKKLNEEYKKAISNRQNIRNLNYEISSIDMDSLTNILDSFNIEKQIICFFNNNFNGNNALKECISILKEIFAVLDELSTLLIDDYIYNPPKKVFSFRELFEQNFLIIKNINHLEDKILIEKLLPIKNRQIELMLILLPFII